MGLYSSMICSIPALSTEPSESTSSMTTMGRMVGRVMCQICCQRLAPSSAADSFSAGSTPVIAARNMIML